MVRIAVHINVPSLLVVKAENEARPCPEVAAEPLQGSHGERGRLRHVPAHLFCRKEGVGPICGQVIGPRCPGPIGRLELDRQLALLSDELRRRLHARGGRPIDVFPLELDLREQPFHLSGVGLILEAGLGPSDDSIQNRFFAVIVVTRAQAAAPGQFIDLLEGLFKPVELMLRAGGCKIVAMHRSHQPTFPMVEQAWARAALREAELSESASILVLPTFGRFLGAVHVAAEPATCTRRRPDL